MRRVLRSASLADTGCVFLTVSVIVSATTLKELILKNEKRCVVCGAKAVCTVDGEPRCNLHTFTIRPVLEDLLNNPEITVEDIMKFLSTGPQSERLKYARAVGQMDYENDRPCMPLLLVENLCSRMDIQQSERRELFRSYQDGYKRGGAYFVE
jgi:hypothetical protein